MRIEVKAKLILTVPNPKKGESIGAIMLNAETHINHKIQMFTTIETKTKVGVRIHVLEGKEIR